MKLCTDCKHYSPAFPAIYSRCGAAPCRSPVTGRPDDFCSIQRAYGFETCGIAGKLWEPKPASPVRWWQFWRAT